jgi:predicted nucleotidyltransferase
MEASGVVVEYNPFHNGHLYHIQEARKVSQSDCVIAVMSGNFLQRGEPAIIDKFHRAKAALASGADLVIELPFLFAVQHSDYFAKGAVHLLHALKTSSICFGSESGTTAFFEKSYQQYAAHQDRFKEALKQQLAKGLSFPEASMHAYQMIGLTGSGLDLSKPNNILGFSYVKTIIENDMPMKIHTIKRRNNEYHEREFTGQISSATSIRKDIIPKGILTDEAKAAMPGATIEQLNVYKDVTGFWHHWDNYFDLVNYRVQTMRPEELREIHGISEGLEYRLLDTAKKAKGMTDWIDRVKTKRYTRTRIQRIFTHILTNTMKRDTEPYLNSSHPAPYLRILGMTEQGQKYLNQVKKEVEIPIIHRLGRNMHPVLELEERASAAYYSILPSEIRSQLIKQELNPPLRLDNI